MSDPATHLHAPVGSAGRDRYAARRSAVSAPARRLRRIDRWRGGAVAASVLLVAALLAVFAYVIASSQSRSRGEAQERFQAQATVTAGLTDALLTLLESQASRQAAKTLSGRLSTARLNVTVRQSQDAYLIVMKADGTVLGASTGAPPTAVADSPQMTPAVMKAEQGRPWFSDVVHRAGGPPLVIEAVPFHTATGARIALVGAPISVLSGFFSHFLQGALQRSSSDGLIVDSAGRVLGSSSAAIEPGHAVAASLWRSMSRAGVQQHQTVSGRRYLVTAPIRTSGWRVVIAEPAGVLYPALIGSRRWVLWVVFAAFALAGLTGVLLLARVLSNAARVSAQSEQIHRANEALSKANAELDAFSYSVSHDLRAPLRAIDGFSRIVIDEGADGLSAEQQRYLGLVRSNTRTMGELIDDLLALSRVGSRPLDRQSVDLHDLVEEVRASFDDDIADRGVEISVGDLPQVRADRTLLRQVFQNLIGNALKYSRERSPARISVTAECDGDEAVLSVRDNGVGFDMRYADKLFQVFQRLHRAEDYEGTGVGLAIVARIVSRHGGRIWADSSPGEGAVFHFTLGADAT